MKKFKITTALNFLLLSFILLIFLLIFYSQYLSGELSGLSSMIYNHPLAVTNEIKDIYNSLDNMQNDAVNAFFTGTAGKVNVFEKITVYTGRQDMGGKRMEFRKYILCFSAQVNLQKVRIEVFLKQNERII
jgi:hypothetical protein